MDREVEHLNKQFLGRRGIPLDQHQVYREAIQKSLDNSEISNSEYEATLARIEKVELYAEIQRALSQSVYQTNLLHILSSNDLPADTVRTPVPDLLPLDGPEMTAELEKPYTSFWLNGEMFTAPQAPGGHNGRVAAACKSSPPVFNEENNRWEIKVSNNLINFDFETPFGIVHVESTPINDGEPEGVVVSQNMIIPTLPAVSIFEVGLKATLPGDLIAISRQPLILKAEVTSWPPPVGTEYISAKPIEFILEDAAPDAKPIFVINPDTTVIKSVSRFNQTE